MHASIEAGLVRACHDLSEGGIAVAAAEMAFAGGLGMRIDLDKCPCWSDAGDSATLLFSESNTRFLVEVEPSNCERFESHFGRVVPWKQIGRVVDDSVAEFIYDGQTVVRSDIRTLKEAWQAPLRW
jgi:phosphoribosylformylglycinamidine synthase